MCEFCTKHGEGKKWYEVMKHYSREMLAEKGRRKYIENFIPNVQRSANANIAKLEWAKKKLPLAHRFINSIGSYRMKSHHFGQVVPLEDAQKITDMVQSITRIACVCRNVAKGAKNDRYCLLLGIAPEEMVIDYSDLSSGLETISQEQAKEFLQEVDKEGLFHSIWTFKTPFIGAICNCSNDCLAHRIQVKSDLLNIMLKAEYIAVVKIEECVGCRNCQKICRFNAVEYSASGRKCYINPLMCYGCGVCRNVCKKEAITLIVKPHLPSDVPIKRRR